MSVRDLNEIQCFVKAVEMKSLTGAAKALGLPKSSVSRKIRNLESRLGLTLLLRTTRALNLTAAGKLYFERSAMALKELEVAENALDSSRQEVEGTLRITGPEEFATGPLNTIITSFLKEYPKIKIELLLTSRVVDLIAEGFDLAFRLGDLADSTLIAKKLNLFTMQFYASPRYLKLRSAPKTLSDLSQHELIGFTPNGVPIKLKLKGPSGSRKELTLKGRFNVNSMLSGKEAAMNGLGIAVLPSFMVGSEIENKTLRAVLPEWSMQGNTVHLIFPGQKFLTPRMRAFIDHVTKNIPTR